MASLASLLTAAPTLAEEVKLPSTITLTAYDTGSSGFNIAVAVGKAIKDKYKSDVRVLPAGNDVARLGPLKANRAQASAMGVGVYFAQEGVFEFATKEWGPQPLQTILTSIDCNNLSVAIAKDTGVTDITGLKGKRVGFVVGSPALNQNMIAMLAFAGLTTKDVTINEFASNGAMWKGMLNNEVDAVFGSNISGFARETESSPRGLFYPVMPHSDKAGWERVSKIGPYFAKHLSTCGVSGSKDKPLETSAYPYPIFTVYGTQKDDIVYSLAKAMVETYDAYKDTTPGASGLDPKTQNFEWVLPVHPAAVKAFKEAGVWKDAHEANNKALLARQKVLADAWASFMKSSPPDDKDDFRVAWMKARSAALTKTGMNPVLE
ncbi:MAG: TAXI family TRAP transporter solute-binding subunit [Hyphomicrobiaceae bacterium]